MKIKRIITKIALFSIIAASAVQLPTAPISAFAAADGGFTEEQIAASEVKPVLTVSKNVLTLDEAKASPVQTITLTLNGADKKYSSTGFHLYFDDRLTLVPNSRNAAAAKGEAISDLSTEIYSKDNCVFLCTAGSANMGRDGVMWTLDFKLPENVKDGDRFPITVVYEKGKKTEDVFMNDSSESYNKLMQAYFFTKGIQNGYIQVGTAAVKSGDVNCDNKIDLSDAVLILQYVANPNKYGLNGTASQHITDEGLKNADVCNSGDGVTSKDALSIQKYTLKLIKSLPES